MGCCRAGGKRFSVCLLAPGVKSWDVSCSEGVPLQGLRRGLPDAHETPLSIPPRLPLRSAAANGSSDAPHGIFARSFRGIRSLGSASSCGSLKQIVDEHPAATKPDANVDSGE